MSKESGIGHSSPSIAASNGHPNGYSTGAQVPTFDLVAFLEENKSVEETIKRARQTRVNNQPKRKRVARLDLPRERIVELARNSMAKFKVAVSQGGGHNQFFDLVCTEIQGWDLTREEAEPIVREYSQACQPPWSDPEITHKLDDAFRREDGYGRSRGWKLGCLRNERRFLPWGTNRGATKPEDPIDPLEATETAAKVADDPYLPTKPDNDPSSLASSILAENYEDECGLPTIVCFRGDYYVYENEMCCWVIKTEFRKVDLVRSVQAEADQRHELRLQEWKLLHADKPEDNRPKMPTPVRVSRSLIADVDQHIQAMVTVDSDCDPPFWLESHEGDPDPRDLVSMRNGILDLGQSKPVLHPHTNRLFSVSTLTYNFDPGAAEPKRWFQVLRRQFGDDQSSLDTLHEILGCFQTKDTSYQKIPVFIGTPRSGRSTIREVFTAAVGPSNVASTSAVAMADPFGLQSIVGKRLAIMGDLRTGNVHDTAVMMDRLLRISGEDPVEINRKHLSPLPAVKMATRFWIISNELPDFADASGAIVSRYLILSFPFTVPPAERNPRLAKEIIEHELPGILNLAIEGLHRLRERGRFEQPVASNHLLVLAEDAASPIARFVAEECVLGPLDSIEERAADLFDRWKWWAIKNNEKLGTDATFGRNLAAALGNSIEKYRPIDPETKKQYSAYKGIKTIERQKSKSGGRAAAVKDPDDVEEASADWAEDQENEPSAQDFDNGIPF